MTRRVLPVETCLRFPKGYSGVHKSSGILIFEPEIKMTGESAKQARCLTPSPVSLARREVAPFKMEKTTP